MISGRDAAGRIKVKHGLSRTSTYRIWSSMKQRCSSPATNGYARYGGRGIAVCAAWKSFENFHCDMGPRPTEDHELDRIDVNGNYCKKNCRWVTRKENLNNRRTTRKFMYGTERLSMKQLSEKIGVNYNTFSSAMRRNNYQLKLVMGQLGRGES